MRSRFACCVSRVIRQSLEHCRNELLSVYNLRCASHGELQVSSECANKLTGCFDACKWRSTRWAIAFFAITTVTAASFSESTAEGGNTDDVQDARGHTTTTIAASASRSSMLRSDDSVKHLLSRRNVIVIEVEGGSDKEADGHRKDTGPLLQAIKSRGWEAEAVYYRDDTKDELFQHILDNADAFITRINPGKYPTYTEAEYLEMCRRLHDEGLVAMPHPDAMVNYGAKDALVKIRDTAAGLPDTYAYYDLASLQQQFPRSIAAADRVLKQNRGSTGEGIWVVKPHGWVRGRDEVTLDTLVECTEMVDNHTEIHTLKDFMAFCEQYVVGDAGMLVDQRFLPRIVEGEVRILMIHDTPMNVVHKKPAAGSYSATLFSGAKYTYDLPSDPKWQPLVRHWLASLPQIRKVLGDYDYPLIWTADFILDTDSDGQDVYRLGEMNCSCVGFTTQLELAENVADAVVEIVNAAKQRAPVTP